ncbi:MAG TPA: flagellar biosynthetic protein FliR [Solirubrobacteraceae bacterium]
MSVNQLLAQFSENQVAGFMLVLARVSPLFLLAPLFSSKMLPARARGIVAVALALALFPIAAKTGGQIPLDGLSFGALILKELLVGAAFSFVLATLFAAVSAAGSMIDMLIGFSFSSLVDPVNGNQSSIMANVYSLLGIAVFIAISGDAWVIEGLARTYKAVPLLGAPQIGTLTKGAELAFSGVFGAAVEICAPVMLALIITDAAFGVVSRVVPQLNVFAVGFPAKMVVGLTVIGASLPFVSGWLGDQLQQSVMSALAALKVV